jgi:RNA polymerase sigma-70 factor (ECF subfamily)
LSLVFANNGTELSDLVARIISGDPTAKEDLVRRYGRGITIIITQIVRCPDAAADVYQETFRIVFEQLRLGKIREPERLSGFVTTVARNTAYQHLREANRSTGIDDIPKFDSIPDPAPSPLDSVLRDETSVLVQEVINELRVDRDRQLLYRRYVVEEDKDTICRDLGLTRKQYNNVIYRAHERFKELVVRKAGLAAE